MAAKDPLLSELCGICHTNVPKYKCPRCSAQTCCLPCYKKHQQRAECSGKRDPTKYMPRNQLSSASGVDHDFNFISGIERSLGKKDQEAVDREKARVEKNHAWSKRNFNFDRRLRETRVIIDKAPEGMSRQRQNYTRLPKGARHIIWTVEWILADGSRSFDEGVHDNLSLAQAYLQCVRTIRNKRARLEPDEKQNDKYPSPQHKKMKRDEGKIGSASTPADQTSENKLQTPAMHKTNLSAEVTDDEPGHASTSPKKSSTVSSASTPKNNNQIQYLPADTEHYFYLVKPRCNSDKRVLIPVDRTACLFECLAGQIVLEFPTIQVLREPPDALPTDFILENDYLEEFEKDQQEIDELLAKVKADELRRGFATADVQDEEDDWDDQKVLEVLRKDAFGRT